MKGYWVCIYEKINNVEKLKEYAVKAKPAIEQSSGNGIYPMASFKAMQLLITQRKTSHLQESTSHFSSNPGQMNSLRPIQYILPNLVNSLIQKMSHIIQSEE